MNPTQTSRRSFLHGGLALAGAGVFGGARGAQGADSDLVRRASPLDPLVSVDLIKVAAECEASRATQAPAGIITSRMYLAESGVPVVRSISDYLERKHGPVRALSQGRRVVSGAATRLAVGGEKDDRFVYVANHHLLHAVSRNIDPACLSNPVFDITVIESGVVGKFPGDKDDIPTTTLANSQLSNDTMLNSRVELSGVSETGSYTFVGTPFPVRFRIGGRGEAPGRYTAFGLRLPAAFTTRRDSFLGMSGSPVTLRGTRTVVGVFSSRVTLPADDISYADIKSARPRGSTVDIMMFTGPDELRDLVDAFRARNQGETR